VFTDLSFSPLALKRRAVAAKLAAQHGMEVEHKESKNDGWQVSQTKYVV
jgi:hypothetical protein